MSENGRRPYKRQPISYATRQFIKERDRYRCVDCGTHLNLTVDHIVAVAEGGTNDISNLTTRCQSCNSSKGTGEAPVNPTGRQPLPRPDRLSMAADRPLGPSSLVGSFFHSSHTRGWQGVVVAEVAPQVYLVELFDWLIGTSSQQSLVTLDEMRAKRWHFYDDAEWMNNTYEYEIQAQWDAARKENVANAF